VFSHRKKLKVLNIFLTIVENSCRTFLSCGCLTFNKIYTNIVLVFST